MHLSFYLVFAFSVGRCLHRGAPSPLPNCTRHVARYLVVHDSYYSALIHAHSAGEGHEALDDHEGLDFDHSGSMDGHSVQSSVFEVLCCCELEVTPQQADLVHRC